MPKNKCKLNDGSEMEYNSNGLPYFKIYPISLTIEIGKRQLAWMNRRMAKAKDQTFTCNVQCPKHKIWYNVALGTCPKCEKAKARKP